ncbi:MAG: bifunctional adenosylcobinamide kinase/adenosylcobinamide-phosphate guanylyltransferase [Pseudobutyrivibrio sp.]|nr:bifunctional adenosylcobinamide kinase/adenosylcobinamide-phosphate guanylyltransferase [Pseudobutyrivibrio sp.]
MITLILGGMNSGKSAYAEDILVRLSGNNKRYYVATMRLTDKDSRLRREKHRRQRQGKDFETIEEEMDLKKVADSLNAGAFVLLECIANLTGNLMFSDESFSEDEIKEKVLKDVDKLSNKCRELVIVSSQYPLEDEGYDESTKKYVKLLDTVNEALKEESDTVLELSSEGIMLLKGKAV